MHITTVSMKKYSCIVKVGNDKFVKYRLSDLLKFVEFLDREWSDWRWFNVYDKESKTQLANYTRANRPSRKQI